MPGPRTQVGFQPHQASVGYLGAVHTTQTIYTDTACVTHGGEKIALYLRVMICNLNSHSII